MILRAPTIALVIALAAGFGACSSADEVSGAPTLASAPSDGGADGGATSQTPGVDGGTVLPDGSGAPPAVFQPGNPNGSCKAGLPARAQLADTSQPTTKVGSGTAGSCTEATLAGAVAKGGVIVFDCGNAPVSIPITATLKVPVDRNTVIDGGGKVTLDGQGAVQVLRFDSANFRANENGLTLQRLRVVGGKTTPTEAIPAAPAPCSQGFNDGEGGALYVRDGNVAIVECIFENDQAALLGPDTGGGAIYVVGSKHGITIAKSTFTNNRASNGGAVGTLFAQLDVYDSLFSNNTATGNGANSDDASKCSVINNGQHEVGSGGNGGALYNDGTSTNVTLCGDAILDNHAGAGAFGGGLFFTSNDFGGTLSIVDSTITGNTGGHWTSVAEGSVQNAGTAVGTNAKSITITSSTVQGVP